MLCKAPLYSWAVVPVDLCVVIAILTAFLLQFKQLNGKNPPKQMATHLKNSHCRQEYTYLQLLLFHFG